MANIVKKHEFLLPFARLFTRGMEDAFDSLPFESTESFGDEEAPALASPRNWSVEAVSVMSGAAHPAVPADLRANEENTVPSWLWKHQSRSARRESEADLRDIFNRAVGSATAKAWKFGFFTSEKHARSFYDEARFSLMHRHMAIHPDILASWGLSWAYGLEENGERQASRKPASPSLEISNTEIDSLLNKKTPPSSAPLWKKLFGTGNKAPKSVLLRLRDIAADWHSSSPNPAQTAIDLLSLRHKDGSVDIEALRQTARILVALLDLQERTDVTIGLANLSPLLLGLGLSYDSDAGRAMAASVIALVTAECVATSAEMAALRGMSAPFSSNRENVMRALRNHRRAVYGDKNDYEKLSVLPNPLPLKNCPNLSLVAEAQRRWDDAVEMAHTFGLRATQSTDLTPSPVLCLLMESASQGLSPIQSLTKAIPEDCSGASRLDLHPSVREAFIRMGYSDETISAATRNILGMRSLHKSPHINMASLKQRGLDEVSLENILAYLPCVNTIRLAVTPWIIGPDVCSKKLGIPPEKISDPRFDLLRYLGFSETDIDVANDYYYGRNSVRNAKALPLRHRPLFACGNEIGNEARIRMASAVQSFVSVDTGLEIRLSNKQSAEYGANATLSAWCAGLKSLTLVFDPELSPPQQHKKAASRQIKAKVGTLSRKAAETPSRPFVGTKKKAPPALTAKKAPQKEQNTARNSS